MAADTSPAASQDAQARWSIYARRSRDGGATWSAPTKISDAVSGNGYDSPAGFDEFILMDHAVDPFTEPGDRRAIYSRPFNARLPAYHRLDVSVEQSFDLGIALVTLHGALLNVYDRANVFHLDLFTGERTDQLPLFPVLGLNVAFP